MRNNKLVISISKPVREIFTFVLNPKNTQKWIDSILVEETNEWPVKKGTIYRNKSINDIWIEYKLSDFKKDEMFVMTKSDNNYHVKYTFTPVNESTTQLTYYEWVDRGELDEPFTLQVLEKLNSVLEEL